MPRLTSSEYQRAQKKRTGSGEGGDTDFIQTPPIATELLMEVEGFDGGIWEPACGRGAISKVLAQHGYRVRSTDLIDRGFGTADVNFFEQKVRVDNIVTNPPYSLFCEFISHALRLARRKVALLLPLVALGGSIKRISVLMESKPARVWAFHKKVPYLNHVDEEKPSVFPHMWVVWEKGVENDHVELRWLRRY